MRRNMGIANEKGLTLVEILAALVILGIVFIGYMTIFPQMTNFNEKTYAKLETMNLARKKLDDINGTMLPTECAGESDKCIITDYEEDEEDKILYKVELEYKMQPDLDSIDGANDQVALHQVHIRYYKLGQEDKPISETFGYVQN